MHTIFNRLFLLWSDFPSCWNDPQARAAATSSTDEDDSDAISTPTPRSHPVTPTPALSTTLAANDALFHRAAGTNAGPPHHGASAAGAKMIDAHISSMARHSVRVVPCDQEDQSRLVWLAVSGVLMYIALTDVIVSLQHISTNQTLPVYRPTAAATTALSIPPAMAVMLPSWCSHLQLFFRNCWDDRNSRHILIFLTINFAFMFVEFVYGLASNSLSLVSDAGHMLLDCMGLVIGLVAAYIARVKPNARFTYGYGRIEILSGFVNAIFLVYIAYFVCVEALERFANPPKVHGDQLVLVAVCGFVVNMVGLALFHQHAHGGSGGAKCEHTAASAASHGHSHSHADTTGHAHNHNMFAIYIHIMADALGSLGVIVSSILIKYFGWMIADPVCSIFISILILMSVWPLVTSSAHVLMQGTPTHAEVDIKRALHKISLIDGVVGYRDPHFWLHSSDVLIGSLHVR